MVTPELLATKLRRPSLPAKWVPRPHLAERLQTGLTEDRTLTLVSAPAGYGKTTCVSTWLSELDPMPIAWLSLDAADADPTRFLLYFISALQQLQGDLGREIERVVRSGQLPPEGIIATQLLNELLSLPGKNLLVLDDFHVLQDRFTLEVLQKILLNLPQSLHMVLITREDPPFPLAHLRASNRLTEIRANDLRFSASDAKRFLDDVMHLSLSESDVVTLDRKTEGWIAGLQLAGLSIRDKDDPSTFIAALSGGHRLIFGYLIEQVLRAQPEEVQSFLLETSILDELTGDLCNAVTGRGDAELMLEQLVRTNLFLLPRDDVGRWYRYHQLFAELLRELLKTRRKEDAATLHMRASEWYAGAGMTSEAIEHALAAGKYASVVMLLESHAMEMVMQGYAETVHRWIEQMPARWESASTRTNLAFAWMHLLRGAYDEADRYVERSRAGQAVRLEEAERRSLEAEWLVIDALRMYMLRQPQEGKELASQALRMTAETDGRLRSLAYYALASNHQLVMDYASAVTAYQEAIVHARSGDSVVAELLSTVGLALSAFEHGELMLAYEIVSSAKDRVERSASLPPISAVLYGLLGEIYYQWFQLDHALRNTRRAQELSILGGYASGEITCSVLLSRIYQLAGDFAAAEREIQEAAGSVRGQIPDDLRREVEAQQVRNYLARDLPSAAVMVLQGHGFSFGDQVVFPDLPAGPGFSFALAQIYTCGLRTLLAQARLDRTTVQLGSGIALASRLVAKAEQYKYTAIVVETLVLRAQMTDLLTSEGGAADSSTSDYIRALEAGERDSFIAVFTEHGAPLATALDRLVNRKSEGALQSDYVRRILQSFSAVPDRRLSPLGVPGAGMPLSGGARSQETVAFEGLTPREKEILGLLAEGKKYKEISDGLFISVNTVRYHVKSIYGKLAVNNRTQAIEAARGLQIL